MHTATFPAFISKAFSRLSIQSTCTVCVHCTGIADHLVGAQLVAMLALVAAVVPELADRDLRLRGLDVLAHALAPIALDEVKAPAVKAHIVPQPAQPLLQVLRAPCGRA